MFVIFQPNNILMALAREGKRTSSSMGHSRKWIWHGREQDTKWVRDFVYLKEFYWVQSGA